MYHNIDFDSEELKLKVLRKLEKIRWPNGVISPFFSNSKVYKDCVPCSYVCRRQNTKFNVLSKTFLRNKRISIVRWDLFVNMLAQKKHAWDIAMALNINDEARYSMYKIVFDAYRYAMPNRNYELHDTLIKKMFHAKTPTEIDIWKKLLKVKNNKYR
jgi:hypothetical protein